MAETTALRFRDRLEEFYLDDRVTHRDTQFPIVSDPERFRWLVPRRFATTPPAPHNAMIIIL